MQPGPLSLEYVQMSPEPLFSYTLFKELFIKKELNYRALSVLNKQTTQIKNRKYVNLQIMYYLFS